MVWPRASIYAKEGTTSTSLGQYVQYAHHINGQET